MTINTEHGTYENVFLRIGEYLADNSVAVQAWNREGAIASLTVCLRDKDLEEGEAYIDTNNCPWALDFIEKEGLGKRTGKIGKSGYCLYPVVEFDMNKLEKEAGL